MFGNQQFTRYTSTGFNNARPWWFYGLALALLMAPWTLILPWTWIAKLSRRMSASTRPHPEPDGLDTGLQALCVIWLFTITVFFSIPSSKLVGYMLPVMPPAATLIAHAWHTTFGENKDRWFNSCALMAGGLGLALTMVAGQYTMKYSAKDVAQALACRAWSSDPVLVMDGYPYDLPFYAQLPQPMQIIQDWDGARASPIDDWRRELIEASQFDPAVGERTLRDLDTLASASAQPHAWLLAPSATDHADPLLLGWHMAVAGNNWSLWASDASVPESPPSTEHIGLPGCRH